MTVSIATATPCRIAVCVCTHGRHRALERLLASLGGIRLDGHDPAAVEVIVVDNAPNDLTRAICERVASALPVALHYEPEPVPGITHARNRAVSVALARGADFVVFIDDDDQPRPDWLLELLHRQAETRADLVFGTWVLDEQMPQWARDSGIFRSPSKSKQQKKGGRYGLPDCASTCNMLASRSILERVGANGPVFSHLFCNSGGEDKDFFIRAHGLGARLASAERSVICRSHEPERYRASGLLRRGFKNGCSQVSMARAHGDARRRLKLFGTALAKLAISLILLPFSAFSRSRFMHHLYRIAKSSGVVFTTLTGRSIKYYSRS